VARVASVVLVFGLVIAGCGGPAGASARAAATPVPTTYATPVGLAAQVVIDAFAAAGYTDQGISDISGEAAHALARPDTSSSIVVIGEPVVAVVLSGPLDFAPTAREFLGRFTSPDVLAFWDAQYPLLRNGLTVDEDKTFGAIRIKIGHTRHLSQDGFTLAISRP
jgi:hypothetical protein